MASLSDLGTTTLSAGYENAKALVEFMRTKESVFNEADTRFQFIDRLLVECLGWPRSLIRLERPYGGTYTDYELGEPCQIIWEAKKEGLYFELPAGTSQVLIQQLDSLIKLDANVRAAIIQVQRYCGDRGVQIAVVSNSNQLIAFLATRQDGIPPLQGRCFVIDGYDALIKHFPQLWQMLSPAGVHDRNLIKNLGSADGAGIPVRLATRLTNYPNYRYPSAFQQSLRVLSELLIEDAPNTPEVELRFYEECYCESGALSREGLISRNILAARYAALFDPSKPSPIVLPVKQSKGDESTFSDEVVAESLARRPIVLVGDVGVGKTSFLRHLIHIRAALEFKNSLLIYIDLGSKASLAADLRTFFVDEIKAQLIEKYKVDVYEESFVRGVHFGAVQRFESGVNRRLKEIDSADYEKN